MVNGCNKDYLKLEDSITLLPLIEKLVSENMNKVLDVELKWFVCYLICNRIVLDNAKKV